MFGNRGRDARRSRQRHSGSAAGSVARIVAAGADAYDRKRHLPRILPIAPEQIADESLPARRWILNRLARALRAERNRGRAGHWTYDLNRHLALSQAYAAERRLLAAVLRREAGTGKNKAAEGVAPGG